MPTTTAAAAASTEAVMAESFVAATVMLPWPPVPSWAGATVPPAVILLPARCASTPPRIVLKPRAPPPAKPMFLPSSVLRSTAIAVAVALATMVASLDAETRTSPAVAVS
ncbi:hypothetical protein HPGCJGGD_2562 [Methylobacterium haplocladii]|nr:hypothetical protein HPGCJGGD_2562 [Methylobacterium haplocladii]